MSIQDIEIGDLNEPAQILARNAQTLDAAGETAPEIPNAGPSTAFIGSAIETLSLAMSDLVVASARAADAVQACDAGFTGTEDMNASDVNRASSLERPR